jgi:hypothetical protein
MMPQGKLNSFIPPNKLNGWWLISATSLGEAASATLKLFVPPLLILTINRSKKGKCHGEKRNKH